MKKLLMVGLTGLASAIALGAFAVGTAGAVTPPKPLPRVVVYVESQGLCYDSIVTAQNLPQHGPFQTLEADPDNHCGPDGIKTEFGPGDQGYVGGRWEMTKADGSVVHFLCPLTGGGFAPPNP